MKSLFFQKFCNPKHRIHTSINNHLKKIIYNTKEKLTQVEGIIESNDNTSNYKPSLYQHLIDQNKIPKGCCPLCALNIKLQYTDILIISQFLDQKGNVLDKNISGLCYKQHSLLKRLTEFAFKAGLLKPYEQKNPKFQGPKKRWELYNRVYLDRTLWPRQTVKKIV
ncbi:unnamed protein product [Gordionus sp. m RMFG-2023]|uniref:large ribosomal subunit protein mL66-like n=1 Tax=Gordionus sp. m RMFG-2023 TaxID=3053472 RepID=UPI0030E28224